jgi:predicted nucleotidyltransferase
LREVLAEALRGVKGIEAAFVFGSLAAGAGKGASDVDLFVIGDAGLRALAPVLRRATDSLGREINPVTMTAAEFRQRRGKDAFVRDVLRKEKLFVKGGADELERLG